MPKLVLEKYEIGAEKKKEKKFEKIKNFIENLKIIELDDDEPDLLNKVRGEPFSKKVAITTKNIHILNYLLSNKFNNYLKEVDKIELNNLTNNESRMRLQKEIRSIKREEFEKYLKRRNKLLTIKINEDINNKNEDNNINKRRIFHSKSINLKNSLNLKLFNSIQTINNNSIENNKKQILNKNIFSLNIDKNSLLDINSNSINTTNKKFSRQMSLIEIPKINIFKNFIYNSPNMNTLQMTRNSLNNKKGKTLNRFNSNSIADLNINKNNLDNISDFETKINSKRKKKLLNERPFSSEKNNKKIIKNFTINNNLLNTNKNKYRKFLSEFLPYFNKDNTLEGNNNIKKSNNKNKNKKIFKSKSQLIKFNKNIFNKKLMNKKNFLDSQYIRELKFQKELLKCKRYEFYDNDINISGSNINFVNNYFNRQRIVNDCDVYFNKKLKEFMDNKKSIPNEREYVNIINTKLKEENNKNEENEGYNILNIEKGNEKKKKRRGGLKEYYLNHNYYLLSRIMLQINKINRKKTMINLKLKENRDKIIDRNKEFKRRYLFSENDKIKS